MKIQATLRQINDSIPYFKRLVNENVRYDVGYKLYILSTKLDKASEYLRERANKELEGLTQDEQNAKIGEILETKIELDHEQIDRKSFFSALPPNLSLPPIAFAIIDYALTPENENEEAFKVI